MIDKNVVKKLVDEWLQDQEYFLVDIEISPDNRIVVEIDHADGVWIEDCVALSRYIEERLSRDDEDYELEVGSAGLGQPFKVPQQYINFVGKEVEVLDADGINPQQDVELLQVSTDACIAAMENGEISAALLSDTFAYNMVKDGKLKCIRSLLDTDFASDPCCIIAMNKTFVKENPVISKKVVQCVQKAHQWMREDPEKSTQMMIDEGMNSEDFEMNVMLNNSLQFGLSDQFTGDTLKDFIERYIRLGLITSMDNADIG